MTAIAALPELAPFTAPRPFEQHSVSAANGLRIHAIRQAAAPLVTVSLTVPFGVDTPAQAGTAELLAATLFAGTRDLSRTGIEDEIALAGGALRCSVDPERLSVSVTVLADRLPRTLKILARCLAGASYPDAELDRERGRLVQRVKVAKATPALQARQLMYRHCFADHPITRLVPELEFVLAADAEAVRGLDERHAVPNGATLLLVGDLEPALAAEAAAAAFESWQSAHPATPLAPLPAVPAGREVEVVERPGFRHEAVRMTAASVGRRDPRCAALYLANLVLGGYFSSRLNADLRERNGFVYGVQSQLLEHAGTGITVVEFDSAAATARVALDRVVENLRELAEYGPSPEETEQARRYATGVLSLYLTTREGVLDSVGKVLAAGLEPGWVHEHLANVAEVSHHEVARAARDFFAPEAFSTVIITDRTVGRQGSPEQGE